MKLIIDIEKDYYEMLKYDVEHGQDFKPLKIIANGIPYEERPQGEWEESHIYSCGNILRMGLNVIEHKCKNCGRWSIKWATTIPDNFCSNCGAKMGGEEE